MPFVVSKGAATLMKPGRWLSNYISPVIKPLQCQAFIGRVHETCMEMAVDVFIWHKLLVVLKPPSFWKTLYILAVLKFEVLSYYLGMLSLKLACSTLGNLPLQKYELK